MQTTNREFINSLVESGRFDSEDEVFEEAIRRWRENFAYEEELRAELQKGLDAVERGDVIHVRTPKESRALVERITSEGSAPVASKSTGTSE